MVITVINGTANVFNAKTYLEEQQEFQSMCDNYKQHADEVNAEKSPDKKAYYHRSQDTMILRMMKCGAETNVVVTIRNGSPFLDLEWQYEDRVIENSQGGTTHLQGWYLD